jgi:hypothetical protein
VATAAAVLGGKNVHAEQTRQYRGEQHPAGSVPSTPRPPIGPPHPISVPSPRRPIPHTGGTRLPEGTEPQRVCLSPAGVCSELVALAIGPSMARSVTCSRQMGQHPSRQGVQRGHPRRPPAGQKSHTPDEGVVAGICAVAQPFILVTVRFSGRGRGPSRWSGRRAARGV